MVQNIQILQIYITLAHYNCTVKKGSSSIFTKVFAYMNIS